MRRGPRVRRARLDDLEALVALEAGFPTDRISRASFRHLLTRANAEVWVCDDRGRLCGNAVILYRRRSRTARVYSLVVHAAHHGRGIGNRLMQAGERAALARGCGRMVLEVRSDNGPAQALYRKRGYALTGTLKGFYEDGTSAARMEKILAARGAPGLSPRRDPAPPLNSPPWPPRPAGAPHTRARPKPPAHPATVPGWRRRSPAE